ncbi:DnaJ domain-containing protein [Embleya sp. NPDC050493]|uniref:DnaJ domain-containing protein n=1 Tax=Embleya sp. NPDC050493 TaxID=3363989 RepID=UPI0037967A83
MAVEQQDPYVVLGVSRTASDVEITAAFRALVRALHPDSRPDRPEARERLQAVLTAYHALRKSRRRTAHLVRDTTVPAAPPPGPPVAPGFVRTVDGDRRPVLYGLASRSWTRTPLLRAGPVRWTPE